MPRKLSESDLLRVKLWYEVGDTLTKERSQRLFRDIAAQPNAKQVQADDLVIIDVETARQQITKRARELEAAEAVVVQIEAVLCGSLHILAYLVKAFVAWFERQRLTGEISD